MVLDIENSSLFWLVGWVEKHKPRDKMHPVAWFSFVLVVGRVDLGGSYLFGCLDAIFAFSSFLMVSRRARIAASRRSIASKPVSMPSLR